MLQVTFDARHQLDRLERCGVAGKFQILGYRLAAWLRYDYFRRRRWSIGVFLPVTAAEKENGARDQRLCGRAPRRPAANIGVLWPNRAASQLPALGWQGSVPKYAAGPPTGCRQVEKDHASTSPPAHVANAIAFASNWCSRNQSSNLKIARLLGSASFGSFAIHYTGFWYSFTASVESAGASQSTAAIAACS